MAAISVLMGTYNEKNRAAVALAIDSVLNQTFTDFEFIICDDGSGHGFYRWLQNYCRKDRRIKLLRNAKNQGLAAALNRCLAHAKGDYIARMDADDVSAGERFAKQYAFLESHPEYALVGCCVEMTGKQGAWGIRRLEEMPGKKSFLKTSPFVHPTILIRRDVMGALGGYSRERSACRAEDYEFFMRLYAAGYRGYNLQETLFSYREDLQSYQKRKYRYRILECLVRFRGFRKMGILKGNLRYVVKPLAVGLVPARVMQKIRRRRYAWDRADMP